MIALPSSMLLALVSLGSGSNAKVDQAVGTVAPTATVAAGSGPVSYSSDFNGTESPISEQGAWTHAGLDWTFVRTANGLAFGTQTGSGGFDDSYAHLTGFPADQSATGVIHRDPAITGSTTHEVEILLRWADAPHVARGYECNLAFDGAYAQIVRWNGPFGDFTYLASGSVPGGVHDGDTVTASAVGNVITLYVNGSQIASATDSTWTTGNPGMGFWRGAPNDAFLGDYCFTRYTATAIGPATPAPVAFGWIAFCFGALLGVGILVVRRQEPKQPRAAPC